LRGFGWVVVWRRRMVGVEGRVGWKLMVAGKRMMDCMVEVGRMGCC
jgi:hypothetical protein